MSALFKVGEVVIYVNSNEKGVITEVCPPARGRQLYKVSIDNIIRNCLESNLMADIDLPDPFKRLEQGVFGSFLDFSRLNTSFKIKNTSNNTISTLIACKLHYVFSRFFIVEKSYLFCNF